MLALHEGIPYIKIHSRSYLFIHTRDRNKRAYGPGCKEADN